MGTSMALAGTSACTLQPEERIVPYVRAPEEIIPGKPLFFATAISYGGYGMGLLVESHDGTIQLDDDNCNRTESAHKGGY